MPTDQKRSLLWHGIALFLIGLLTGLVEQHFTNVRMGLAAHLEGVMNGTFLLAVGGRNALGLGSWQCLLNYKSAVGAAFRENSQTCRYGPLKDHPEDVSEHNVGAAPPT